MRLPSCTEVSHVMKPWTRVRWQPRRLVALAAPLGVVGLVSMVVGGPSRGQSLLCDVGGSCTAVYARGAFAAAGAVAGTFALILVAVASARWLRSRRSTD